MKRRGSHAIEIREGEPSRWTGTIPASPVCTCGWVGRLCANEAEAREWAEAHLADMERSGT